MPTTDSDRKKFGVHLMKITKTQFIIFCAVLLGIAVLYKMGGAVPVSASAFAV